MMMIVALLLAVFVSVAHASYSSPFGVLATVDSTSGVLVNRSFEYSGIIEVMQAIGTGNVRYPGTPAVAGAFDPVQVWYMMLEYYCVNGGGGIV